MIKYKINDTCEKYIVVIGHRWGTDDAIQATAAAKRKVDYLVTLDAVGRRDISSASSHASRKVKREWINCASLD